MICMRRCKCCQMPYFTHFLFFVIIQNIAESFETDGKLLVSIVRLEPFIWRGRAYALHMKQVHCHFIKKVEADQFVYLFEFKRDETAENALNQIENKSYALPFAADRGKLLKIDVSFDSESRLLVDWKGIEDT